MVPASRKRPTVIAAFALSALWAAFGLWCWGTGRIPGSTLGYLLSLGTFGLYPVIAWLLGWSIYSGPLSIKPPAQDPSVEAQFYRALIAVLGAGALAYAAWELGLGTLSANASDL